MERPFFNSPIAELEREYEARLGDVALLEILEAELVHRLTPRGRALAAKVAARLGEVSAERPAARHAASTQTAEPAAGASPVAAVAPEPAAPRSEPKPYPPVTNTPDGVLSAWTALEVLSPPGFRRRNQKLGDQRRLLGAWLRGSSVM